MKHPRVIAIREDLLNNENDRCRISKWEVVLGAQDRVNIPCLMHDTRLCQIHEPL